MAYHGLYTLYLAMKKEGRLEKEIAGFVPNKRSIGRPRKTTESEGE